MEELGHLTWQGADLGEPRAGPPPRLQAELLGRD